MEATARSRQVRQKIAGLRLRALRHRYGLDAGEASSVLSLSEPELKAVELGREPAPTEGFWLLAHHLGVSPAQAFRAVEAAPSPGALSDRALVLRRKALGAALAADREACGLSVEAAEASVGLPENWLLGVERGELSLSLGDVEGLAALYGKRPEEWLSQGVPPGEATASSGEGREASLFMRRPQSNRYVLAAMALSRLDEEALSALEDAITLLRQDEA